MAENQSTTPDPNTLYTPEELQNLRDLFNIFDKDNSGAIDASDLDQLMSNLGKDPTEGKLYIAQNLLQEIDPDHNGMLTFDEFIILLNKVERQLSADDEPGQPEDFKNSKDILPDTKVLDFLRLLEEYRKKCEDEGNYNEAKKAKSKYDELQTIRQLNTVRQVQEKELQSIEEAQRGQFLEFSTAWDNYMADYEATAYMSLEKLKEKHMLEFQAFHEKVVREARMKVKHSKELLELRKKQQVLAKQKHYEEAEQVKARADQLEQWETARNEAMVQQMVEKKEKKLRKSQQLALAALLKRIQRDRNEQLKHRQLDSQRLIQRNKNVRNDLISKQNTDAKKTLSQIKRNLGYSALEIKYFPGKSKKKQSATSSRFV